MALDARAVGFDDLNGVLAERVPEVQGGIDAQREWWMPEEPGQHIMYGNVLTPYLERLLATGENEKRLRELFVFLEELSVNKDQRVQEVVSVTILEHLLGWRRDLVERARTMMGPATLASSWEIEEAWRASDRMKREKDGVGSSS